MNGPELSISVSCPTIMIMTDRSLQYLSQRTMSNGSFKLSKSFSPFTLCVQGFSYNIKMPKLWKINLKICHFFLFLEIVIVSMRNLLLLSLAVLRIRNVIFWHGSDPDPRIRNGNFCFPYMFSFLLLFEGTVHLHHFSKIKVKEVTKYLGIRIFLTIFAWW